MKKLTLLAVALLAVVLAAPASSGPGKLTLHPAGFGSHSNAHWKAHQGLPDTTGNDDQALYFQKLTTTSTVAAGVAVVRGIEGTPAEQLTGLAWDHREDGHCGAGAPRWNVVYRAESGGGSNQVLFLGCNAAAHSEGGTYNGYGWCRDTQPSPAALIDAATGGSVEDYEIAALAIVFDEGNDTPNPPPAGCEQEQPFGGFVHLDNITVTVGGQTHCWSGANDNGSGGASACPQPTQAAGTTPAGLGVPMGLPVDPLDLGMVNALGLAYPGVPLTAWRLYPNVVG